VIRYDAQHWARSFIEDLASDSADSGMEKTHIKEASDQIRRAIESGEKIALFLDYDGTLREIEVEPSAATPNLAIETLLRRLEQKPDLDITILSGRSETDLAAFFGSFSFRLIAEHGASWRQPGKKSWARPDHNLKYAWKDKLLPILRVYEQATPGSMVEEKPSAIVWHYRKADEEFGEWKANRLTQELSALAANQPIKVRHGKKMVEVNAAEINKGAAVARVLEKLPNYGIAICAGDDLTDEGMFELTLPRLLTIKVGPGLTQARFRIADPAAFRQFLGDLFR
jgi:trehalose 6-phosphate synthase/phosphatase